VITELRQICDGANASRTGATRSRTSSRSRLARSPTRHLLARERRFNELASVDALAATEAAQLAAARALAPEAVLNARDEGEGHERWRIGVS
jgi:hypothetical protein